MEHSSLKWHPTLRREGFPPMIPVCHIQFKLIFSSFFSQFCQDMFISALCLGNPHCHVFRPIAIYQSESSDNSGGGQISKKGKCTNRLIPNYRKGDGSNQKDIWGVDQSVDIWGIILFPLLKPCFLDLQLDLLWRLSPNSCQYVALRKKKTNCFVRKRG